MAITLSEILNRRPADIEPQIYGYTIPDRDHEGYIKIGYTEKPDVEDRIWQQLGTATIRHETLFAVSAMREDGSVFTDKDVHNLLLRKGFEKMVFDGTTNNEWIKCSKDDALTAIKEISTYARFEGNRTEDFKMRQEQLAAVNQTEAYFRRIKKEEPNTTPKFLWNAKMRFGKTFAAYQLAKKMGMKRILILTFKPVVEDAWGSDLNHHVDFKGWQFVSNKEAKFDAKKIDEQYRKCDKEKPIVVFGSFQDLLGTNESGGIKAKNEFIHTDNWDMVILDEYHFGAWRDNAKKLFEEEDEEEEFDIEEYQTKEAGNAINESWLPITTDYYLYLSGTPFRALNSGEFLEEQIFSWTYSDEQAAKENWDDSKGKNPYAALPKMVMMTYKIPDSIAEIAVKEGYDEFDLNEFFKAEISESGKVEDSRFVYEEYVQKWVKLIQGEYMPVDGLILGSDKPPMPYSDGTLLNVLIHTLWYLPKISSCFAMRNLLRQPQNRFFNDYEIVVAAGTKAGIGIEALNPGKAAMGDPLKTKTITLTCNKLNTGVTIRPWSGVFMLKNLKSPETYFQTAFRVQSPWTMTDVNGDEIILKKECYLFDFALERALSQISDYSLKLDVNNDNSAEKKVGDFIHFLPILAFDGAGMNEISAQDVLDITYAGTSATLLAKRWQTALLVHVDNDTLKRLQANPQALDALKNLEGFRTLGSDIQTIINKSEKIKKAKTREDADDRPEKEKKELTQEEKEMKSLRKQIQDNLLKLAARIPAFMYLTDYREQSLKDVITQIEPELFRKVTGLSVADFDTLCSIGLFDPEKMNQGIFGFRRYENSSLSYTGIDKHEGEDVGGWDTVLKRDEYNELYAKQQATMTDFIELIVPTETEKKIKIAVDNKTQQTTNTNQVPLNKPQSGFTREEVAFLESILPKIKSGNTVNHKKFGKGIIIGLKDRNSKIVVRFSDGEKVFVFPDSFIKGFLTID